MTSRGMLVGLRLGLVASTVAVTLLGGAAPAHAARDCNYFDFNKSHNINSDLFWLKPDNNGVCGANAANYHWRAGSGVSEDTCAVNQGWLPNGWYDLSGMLDTYNGSLIRGRVWHLQDKQCGDGTWRTQLFIHTEETSGNGQDCTSNADDPWCWDSTKANPSADVATNDYFSEACIKVRRGSPEGNWTGDIGNVHDTWHNNTTNTHGDPRSDSLYVGS